MHAKAWAGLFILGILGVLGIWSGASGMVVALYLVPLVVYQAFALRRASLDLRTWQTWSVLPGMGFMLGGLLGFLQGPMAGTGVPAIVGATGMQVMLFGLGAGRMPYKGGRGAVMVLGHVAAVIGSHRIWTYGMDRIAAAAYAGALVVLSLNAYWAHRAVRDDGTLRSWEAPFLITFGLGGIFLALSPLGWLGDPVEVATFTLLLAILGSVALLAGPPHLPPALRARPGGLVEFLSQAVALVLLLNVLLILIILRFPVLTFPFLALAMTWLVVAVLSEYGAVLFGRRAGGDPPQVETVPLTVVVSAMDEEQHIEVTLQDALALPGVQRLVVALAGRSQDRTAAIVADVAARDARVVVETGLGRSKAEDLTQAWKHVETDVALLLDADEKVQVETLAYGLQILADHPDVGIVQGRKAARPQGWLGHFNVVERRYSTLADHPAQDRIFGAAHFAGSAALVRRQVPEAAGWWRTVSLTEDIEFTMRVHMDTPWHIRYEPRFVVWEEPPVDARALVRQRSRWARGWSQVSRLYLTRLPRAQMPWKGKVGLGWQMLTAISAPWSVFFPTLLTLWIWGESIQFPLGLAIALGLIILPSRIVTFGVPYFRDPWVPVGHRIRHAAGAIVSAYLWVLTGWLLQLHAMYLEMSAAPKTWHATRIGPK